MTMPRRIEFTFGISLPAGGVTAVVMAQDNFDRIEIQREKLADHITDLSKQQ